MFFEGPFNFEITRVDCIYNMELNDLRIIICLRKSEVTNERILVCSIIENLMDHGIHCLSCSFSNDDVVDLLS